MRHRDCSGGDTELWFSCFVLFSSSSGWSGRAAGGDGGDARQLPGGGGVPAAGAAQGTGPLQQELPHPAVPPAEGRAEEPASGPDWPGGRRAAEESGAGPEGLWKTESLSPCLLRLWSLGSRPYEFVATTFTQRNIHSVYLRCLRSQTGSEVSSTHRTFLLQNILCKNAQTMKIILRLISSWELPWKISSYKLITRKCEFSSTFNVKVKSPVDVKAVANNAWVWTWRASAVSLECIDSDIRSLNWIWNKKKPVCADLCVLSTTALTVLLGKHHMIYSPLNA